MKNDSESRKEKLELTIRLEREDDLPAFGAFLRCEEPSDNNAVVLLNVAALMDPVQIDETGQDVPMSREDRKIITIVSLMHEFGHALEKHFNLPENEEAIEKACEEWEKAYHNAEGNNIGSPRD